MNWKKKKKKAKKNRKIGREPVPQDAAEMMALMDAHIEKQLRLTPPHMKLKVKIRKTTEGMVLDFDRVRR